MVVAPWRLSTCAGWPRPRLVQSLGNQEAALWSTGTSASTRACTDVECVISLGNEVEDEARGQGLSAPDKQREPGLVWACLGHSAALQGGLRKGDRRSGQGCKIARMRLGQSTPACPHCLTPDCKEGRLFLLHRPSSALYRESLTLCSL